MQELMDANGYEFDESWGYTDINNNGAIDIGLPYEAAYIVVVGGPSPNAVLFLMFRNI